MNKKSNNESSYRNIGFSNANSANNNMNGFNFMRSKSPNTINSSCSDKGLVFVVNR